MKKIYMLFFAALMLLSGCEYDDTALNDRIDSLEERVSRLEELCNRINSDMDALRTMITALENQNYVTGVEPLVENGIETGTVIRFSNGESAVIRNGGNGADGQDGADGIDGYVPEIGTREDVDGILYWTLDGSWLLDAQGNKVPVAGKDGADGQDGQDGADGQDGQDGADGKPGHDGQDGADGKPGHDGQDGADGKPGNDGQDGADGKPGQDGPDGEDGADGKPGHDGQDGADGKPGHDGADGKPGADGKDGVCPLLKIVDGMWYVSTTGEEGPWIEVGPADGKDGVDGADGDSLFSEIINGEDEVVIVLSDGRSFTFPKASNDVCDRITAILPVYQLYSDKETFELNVEYGYHKATGSAVFSVSPRSAAAEVAADWQNLMKLKLYRVKNDTRAVEPIEAVINECHADAENGFLFISYNADELTYLQDLSVPSDPQWRPGMRELPVFFGCFLEVGEGESQCVSEAMAVAAHDQCISMLCHLEGAEPLVFPDTMDGVAYYTQMMDFDGNAAEYIRMNAPGRMLEKEVFQNNTTVSSVQDINVDSVEAEAFKGSSVYLVGFNQLHFIGDRAFADCPNLAAVVMECPAPDLGKDVFPDRIPDIHIYYFYEESYRHHPDWKPYLDHIKLIN